jgi:outer membrane protein
MGRWSVLALMAGTLFFPSIASAQTLREALEQAYRTNPDLTGARAGLRAIDEGVPLARAAGRPAASATTDFQEFIVRSSNSFSSPLRAASAGVNLSVPLYRGGGVRNSVRAADARVLAGRADLRTTEADVFTAVVTAYMDVLRDQAIAGLETSNVRILRVNLQANSDRFEIGDLTRTDVAQSQARLALAEGRLETAQAQVDVSSENFLRVVGSPPVDLQPPPPLPALPATAATALDIALENNPQLIAAKEESRATEFDIRVAKASRLPQLSAIANSGYNNYLGTLGSSVPGRVFTQAQQTATIGLGATIPLYQGGAPASRVRRAQALSSQSLERIVAIERIVVANTRGAFSRFSATRGVIRSSEVAVSANELALEGVRLENSVGTRNVLDVLNAEQELLNSRVQLVTARRDSYVAGFTLLAAIGRAEAATLGGDGSTLYQPLFGASEPKPRF